jgi:mRNA interferase RelE/StbE
VNARYSKRFLGQYAAAPPLVQKAFDKQVGLLLENLHHPSLRAKKYSAVQGIWQARVNRDWRFYFTIEGGEYHLHEIITHPK